MESQNDGADPSYRTSHLGRSVAARYDRDFWNARTARGINWTIEQRLLDRALCSMGAHATRALDFACGTGRVLSVLDGRFEAVTGVDVSPEMLAMAEQRCPHSKLVAGDVTVDPSLVNGPIDVITAFRFFLNAEPRLREQVLDWMRSVLAPDGVLIANFHLNPHSLRGTYLRLRWRGRWQTPALSVHAVRDLFAHAGLEIVDVFGYEYLPYRRDGARVLAPRWRSRVERFLAGRGPTALAGSFIVVAQTPHLTSTRCR